MNIGQYELPLGESIEAAEHQLHYAMYHASRSFLAAGDFNTRARAKKIRRKFLIKFTRAQIALRELKLTKLLEAT